MKKHFFVLAAMSFLLTGCNTVPTVTIVESKAGIRAPAATNPKTFLLARIVTRIPLGDRIRNTQYGWGCFNGNSVDWRGGGINLTYDEISDSFRKELSKLDYKTAGNSPALLFDNTIAEADYLVAGAIEKLETNVCFPFSGSPNADIGITNKLKGSTYMRIRWQVYSSVDSKMVLETITEGSFIANETITGNIPVFLKSAFEANVRNLLADSNFHNLVKP